MSRKIPVAEMPDEKKPRATRKYVRDQRRRDLLERGQPSDRADCVDLLQRLADDAKLPLSIGTRLLLEYGAALLEASAPVQTT